jgi:hypothetical protein
MDELHLAELGEVALGLHPLFLVDVGHHHLGAVAQETRRDGEADAAASARHYRRLAVERHYPSLLIPAFIAGRLGSAQWAIGC